MKYFLLLFSIWLTRINAADAQDSVHKMPFFVPRSSTISANTNFHWFMYEGLDGNFVDQIYLNGRLKYTDNIDLVIVDKTKLINHQWENKISDAYFNYMNTFKANDKIPIFKYGTYLNLKVGMQEWFPTYTNIQQILENADKFINPPEVYGGSIISITPLSKNNALTAHLSADAGDLINHKTQPELRDLYLNYTKIYKSNLGVSVQAGRAEGSLDALNWAQLIYMPQLERIQLDFRAGKLPTVEETPYGVHIGLIRTFKYISIGGYYERRYQQNTKGEIAGMQWSIVGPPQLVRFVSAFNVFYDFNTSTLWMYVPLIKVDIRHK